MTIMFMYDVNIHFAETKTQYAHWDEYLVNAENLSNARYNAIMRVINEISREYAKTIDCIRIYKHGTDKLLKEYDN